MDPGHDQGGGAKEEKKRESSIGDDENKEISVQVDELEKAKAEMGGVIEENQRLKMSLNKILNEYHTLQMQFQNIAKKETKNSSDKVNNDDQEAKEESELVSLSLGRIPSNPKAKVSKPLKEEEKLEEGLALGLDCKFETSKSESTTEHLQNSSPANSPEVPKDEVGDTWPPSKANKTIKIAKEDEELFQQNPAKKARVCVRARCDAPTMNDGCQWRKYGQKISKGNPCPRAYYRCTVATTCPVRKQVQRCSQDRSILITTYEGTHNHPLPHSATAMASTTSAAASVLLSGSSTTTPPSNNHGLNFYLSDNNGAKSKQFYLSHPSPSNPTVTLDLTSFPPSSNNSSSPLHKFASHYNPSSMLYPSSTSLNFSSSESNAMSWTNGLFQTNNNRNNILGNISMGNNSNNNNNNMYYSYMQRNNGNNNNVVPIISSSHLQDSTIAAATKAITADPNFQSALAAALTSVIGSTSSSNTQGGGVGESLVNKMKWGELFTSSSSSLMGSTNSKAGGCASSLLNKVSTTTTTLPFSSTKSASASPGERDNSN